MNKKNLTSENTKNRKVLKKVEDNMIKNKQLKPPNWIGMKRKQIETTLDSFSAKNRKSKIKTDEKKTERYKQNDDFEMTASY